MSIAMWFSQSIGKDLKAAFLLAVQRLKSSSTITLTKFAFRKYDLSRNSVGHYNQVFLPVEPEFVNPNADRLKLVCMRR